MQSAPAKGKLSGALLGIIAVLALVALYFIGITVAALLIGFIASLFSDSIVISGIWSVFGSHRGDGGSGLIYFFIYLLPFFLSSKVVTVILRNHATAEKWVFYTFGGLLILIFLPLALYLLFTGESSIIQFELCFVGLISIFTGRDH